MLKASARVQGSDFSLILKFLGPRALICALASRCAVEGRCLTDSGVSGPRHQSFG